MDVLDEEASRCCRQAFNNLAKGGDVGARVGTVQWECPRCGCSYQAQDVGAGVRYWRYVVVAVIVRPGG